MAYTHQRWPGIIGLDLGKQTYSGCRLSGEGYVRRRNFTGRMTQDEQGYLRLLDEISTDDLVIMEAGSSSFNLARFLINNTSAEIVVLNPSIISVYPSSFTEPGLRPRLSGFRWKPLFFHLLSLLRDTPPSP